jgi:putative phage-type endonuclease
MRDEQLADLADRDLVLVDPRVLADRRVIAEWARSGIADFDEFARSGGLAEGGERMAADRASLARLLLDAGIPQRTPAWYAARQGLVTASDFAQALGLGKFGTQSQFFCGKSGHVAPRAFDWSVPPLKWGTMYEDVALMVYKELMRVRVHEFGLLTRDGWIGASPDGISDVGVMVEIKCPFRRKIDGAVPKQYYYQIQGQLHVCDLLACDYVEVELAEYSSLEYLACDSSSDGRTAVSGLDHGVVFEVPDEAGIAPPTYSYSPLGKTPDELRAFVRAQQEETKVPGVLHWYRVVKVAVVRVERDDAFVARTLAELRPVWDKVLEYKADRELFEREVGSKEQERRDRSNKDAWHDDAGPVVTGYAFVDDDGAKEAAEEPPAAADDSGYAFVDDS